MVKLKRSENPEQFSLLTSLDYGDRSKWKQRVDSRYSTLGFSHQGDRHTTVVNLGVGKCAMLNLYLNE